MAHRRYRLQIFPRGTVSTTGAPTYTVSSSHFRDAPIVGGQIVRAAECRVESNPWRISLVDVGSTFTAKLADSSGRMHLLGRVCRIQSALNSTASTAYATLGTGRLVDLSLSPDVASYDLSISDERWVERQTLMFTKSNTVAIVPYGPVVPFQGIAAAAPVKWRVIQITGNMVCLRYDGAPPVPTHPDIAQLIVNDLKVGAFPGNTTLTTGNFETLRWHNNSGGTEYEIGAFGARIRPGQRPAYPTDSLYGFWNDPVLLNGNDHTGVFSKLYVWLVWASSQPSLDADLTGYLYAPTHEPTETLPQLIGGSSGLHPGRFVRNAYSGTYSATTSLTVRHSTAAFNTWENEAAYGRVWVRATRPENMAMFLDERMYAPYAVAPVTDSSGKIAPARMWQPTSTQLNLSSLATITSTNVLAAPTWEHPSGEAVTAIRYTQETYPWIINFGWPSATPSYIPRPSTIGTTFTHDTLTALGRRQLDFRLCSVSFPLEFTATTGNFISLMGAKPLMEKLARAVFQRFGDGPLYSRVECSSAIDGTTNGPILPGHFVRLQVGTVPNALTLARTGSRVMQVLSRELTPRGRAFRLLDAGSTLASPSTPTVTLALSSFSSRHGVKATVASLSTGSRYEVHLAHSTSTGSTAAPAASSPRWFPAAFGSTAGLVTQIGQRPSKTRIYARVRATRPNRIGSPWSAQTTASRVNTASITAPSALTVTNLTAVSGVARWTNGSSVYGIEVMVDSSTGASLSSTNVVAQVAPQTTRYTLSGLAANDSHKAGVRHVDPFGGRSAQATAIFTTTTGSAPAAPALRGLVIVEGVA